MASKPEFALHYLELSNTPIRFDSVSQLTNVYFDDSTNKQQVFIVRNAGTIVVKSPHEDTINFVINECGPIRSIKFSTDNNILAVQRTDNEVQLFKFQSKPEPSLLESITYKSKYTVFGFVWLSAKEIAMISSSGVEIFQILVEKKALKSIKTCNLSVTWFAWCPAGAFALIASENNGTTFTPILLKQGAIVKLPKLEIEVGRTILERDVTLGQLYQKNCILILQQQTSNRVVEIVIYMLDGPGLTPRKSHILKLGYNGRFALNIHDNIVIVHHQATKTSHLFDIMLPGEKDLTTGIIYHTPLAAGKPIKPFALPNFWPSLSYDASNSLMCELYSPNWVIFQPNIVIDAKLGCLWHINVNLEALSILMGDNYVKKIDFLMRRTNAKAILISVIHELLSAQYSGVKQPIIQQIFDKLNAVYKQKLDSDLFQQMAIQSNTKMVDAPKVPTYSRVIIDQNDMYSLVFSTMTDLKHFNRILMLYTHSLVKYKITLQQELSKLIITDLIKKKEVNVLHQLLCLSAVNESKALSCFLLSYLELDKRVFQVALDMLQRLTNAQEIIIEILLEEGRVVEALSIAKQLPNASVLSSRKYLEAAFRTKNPLVIHSVFSFFERRNLRLRGTPEFTKQEQCADYVKQYRELFGES